ncbi:WYL domain-containing protein [Methylobacterium bullatum]|uniref:WYL domain-containing protein n=1 Tax=Methylobacterium bullatum TaxID=570505 RepID=A0AAV4ZBH0_9HYPH|nr:WYL domain-containing protein [Methylobacterium bullatum]MBD8902734.1 hypothetical protein [Methylobacterium bullatum]GJD41361.1 hypothetical protein OICFNHDK_3844 [Methylobacterium bullatum]
MTTPSLTNPNPKREGANQARRLRVNEPTERAADAIYIHDEDDNDIATFFHSEHATVGQSYETALRLATLLVEANNGGGASSPGDPVRSSEKVTLDYTNYRGERAIRTITPWGVEWGSTDWHPEPGWLLTCYDHDKAACRTYALSGIHSWNGVAVSPSPGDPVRAALEEARDTLLDIAKDVSACSWLNHPDENGGIFQRIDAALSVSTPTGEGERRIEATQITLGEGVVDIGPITHEGKTGVLFRPRKEHIAFGEAGQLPEGEYWPVPGDVVLWVSGKGPGVAIEALAALAHPQQGGERDGWPAPQPMETAPKDGTRILVEFDHNAGIHAVAWEESVSGSTIWCVDDRKHGPFPLRGYMNALRWWPLPTAPTSPSKSSGEEA